MKSKMEVLKYQLKEEREKNALLSQQLFNYYEQIHHLTCQKEKYKLKLQKIIQKVNEIEEDEE
jgi:uncharacterized membrane protein YgaE (UPF0421/DUF939 family)